MTQLELLLHLQIKEENTSAVVPYQLHGHLMWRWSWSSLPLVCRTPPASCSGPMGFLLASWSSHAVGMNTQQKLIKFLPRNN